MQYLPFGIILLVISFILLIAKKENENTVKNYVNEEYFLVKLPKVYFWVGVVCSIFFTSLLILMILFPNDTAAIWVGLVFIGFTALGLFLTASQIKSQINLYKDYFIYTTVLGRKYNYKYTEIMKVKLTLNTLKIKTVNKTFYVDTHALGLEIVLKRFKENGIVINVMNN